MSKPEITLDLHPEPEVGGRPERSRQAQRHGCGDASVSIENSRQMSSRDSQASRRFTDGHFAEIVAQNLSRMCRIKDHVAPSLVVVLIVHENRVLFVKRKRQSPVATHDHGPMAFQVSLQGMPTASRSVHIFGSAGNIERGEKPSEFLRMPWLNSRLRPGFGELLEPFVPIGQDHLYSVWLQYTECNMLFISCARKPAPSDIAGRC